MPALHFRPRIVLLGRRSGTRALRRLRALIITNALPLDEAGRIDTDVPAFDAA
jgi:hypothetical protein